MTLDRLDEREVLLTTTTLIMAGAIVTGTLCTAAGWSWAGFRIKYSIWILGEVEARDLARI